MLKLVDSIVAHEYIQPLTILAQMAAYYPHSVSTCATSTPDSIAAHGIKPIITIPAREGGTSISSVSILAILTADNAVASGHQGWAMALFGKGRIPLFFAKKSKKRAKEQIVFF